MRKKQSIVPRLAGILGVSVLGTATLTAANLETKDAVSSRVGELQGGAIFSADGGGHSGKPGDRAIDFGLGNGPVHVADGKFINSITTNDQMAVSLWVKKRDIAASSAFWFNSPSSNNGERGYQAHIPWSDDTIYFDTAGCCDGTTQRINAPISGFAGYTGDDSWWTNWHHFVFSKNLADKKIYIDGQLFLDGSSSAPLPTDFTDFTIGSAGDGTSVIHGWIDDFAIYGTELSATDVGKLFSGTSPTNLPASDKLVAYWSFDDVPFIFPPVGSPAGFTVQVNDVGSQVADTNTIALSFNGGKVTPSSVSKTGGVTVIGYSVPNAPLAAGSTNTTSLTIKDTTGASYSSDGSFVVAPFIALNVSTLVTNADTTKPGFVWEMSQVDSVGNDTQNSNQRTRDQLAGLLGPNTADPNAQGVASAPGKPNSNPNLPIDFQIPTVINLNANPSGGDQGNFTPDDQMPGAPGAGGGTDNQAARVITYVNLPAGVVTLGVNSDDGFLTAAGPWNDAFGQQLLGQFDGGRGAADTTFNIYVPQAGTYALFTLWENGGGSSEIEWYSVKADGTKVLLNDSNNGGFKAYRALTAPPPSVAVGQTVSPVPGATGVDPNATILVALADGATPIDKSTVSLKLDGSTVPASINKTGSVTTVTYTPTNLFAALSTHQAVLGYTEAGNPVSRSWQFTIASYTKDKIHSYVGSLKGPAVFTPNGGGHTGKPGDYGIDFGTSGNGTSVHIADASFLNVAANNDVMTFSLWQKRYDTVNSSAFWAVSPSSSSSERGFQAHTPWSDDTIYFDTAGCCTTGNQRLSANINTFAPYNAVGNDGYWTNWHHLVFLKNKDDKQIWIDGSLFLEGNTALGNPADPLPTDFTELYLGADNTGVGNNMHAIIDDFAVFSTAVSSNNIVALSKGTLPTALTGETLLAYWDFEDAIGSSTPPPGPTLTWQRTATGLTIAYTGTLQSVSPITGTWTDVAGATSPYQAAFTGNEMYFRAKQ